MNTNFKELLDYYNMGLLETLCFKHGEYVSFNKVIIPIIRQVEVAIMAKDKI